MIILSLLMTDLEQYISKVSGDLVKVTAFPNAKDSLPFYLGETFDFSQVAIYGHFFFLAKWKAGDFTVGQLGKQAEVMSKQLGGRVILILPDIDANTRSRLVEQRINFICPGKQMFVPYLFLDLREQFAETIKEKDSPILTPSAQLLVLYYLYSLSNNYVGDITSFKELAKLLKYSSMAITKAATELKQFGLCEIGGARQKTLIFSGDRKLLWDKCKSFLGSPVLKTVYVDLMPDMAHLFRAGEYALSFYSDLNHNTENVYAIGKFHYQSLQKSGDMPPQNEKEGRYKLEVWKYQPEILLRHSERNNTVDPISLYLSLRHIRDERVEMALDQILQKYIYG